MLLVRELWKDKSEEAFVAMLAVSHKSVSNIATVSITVVFKYSVCQKAMFFTHV